MQPAALPSRPETNIDAESVTVAAGRLRHAASLSAVVLSASLCLTQLLGDRAMLLAAEPQNTAPASSTTHSPLLFDCQVTLSDDSAVKTTLSSISEGEAHFLRDGIESKSPITAIYTIGFASPQPVAEVANQIVFRDGSVLNAKPTSFTGKAFEFSLSGGSAFSAPSNAVSVIRFAPIAAEQTREWEAAINSNRTSDRIIILKKSGAIDYVDGVLHSLDAEKLEFTMDGEKEPVALSYSTKKNILGIALHPSPMPLPIPTTGVTTTFGHLNATSVSMNAGVAAITTPAGLMVKVPGEKISSIDFTLGRFSYLAELRPESYRYAPSINPAKPQLADFTRNSLPKAAAEFADAHSMILRSHTEASYRIPAEAISLRGTAALHPTAAGEMTLQLKIDGKVAIDSVMSPIANPLDINLKVKGARRLEIIADFGPDKTDQGDVLLFSKLRFEK